MFLNQQEWNLIASRARSHFFATTLSPVSINCTDLMGIILAEEEHHL